MLTPKAHRRELDGLRALAVFSVIFYHAEFGPFAGGFVGVDIFFVLSGYLITASISKDVRDGNFRLIEFFERRARRILPALVAMCLICIPLSSILLSARGQKDFAQSLLATMLFSANHLFAIEGNYFGESAEFKPLMHAWTLSVEEQFYIIFPVFFICVVKWLKQNSQFLAILTIAVASFSLADFASLKYPDASFYLMPTRCWEFLIGTSLALKVNPSVTYPRVISEIGGLTGLALILFSIFSYDQTIPFPGRYALAPTLGAAMFILFVRRGTLLWRLFESRFFANFGAISYSLYLWHQPIFVFARSASIPPLDGYQYMQLTAVAVLVATASYFAIERPARTKEVISIRKLGSLLSLTFAINVSAGAFGHENSGFRERFLSPEYEQQFVEHKLQTSCLSRLPGQEAEVNGCILGPTSVKTPAFALFGDSHAYALTSILMKLAENKNSNFFYTGTGGCPPILGVDVSHGVHEKGVCKELAQQQLDYVRFSKPKTVVLAARWAMYTEGDYQRKLRNFFLVDERDGALTIESSRKVFERNLRETVSEYSRYGARVFVVLQAPQQEFQPEKIYHEIDTRHIDESAANKLLDQLSVTTARHRRLQQYNAAVFHKLKSEGLIEIIDPAENLCTSEFCSIGRKNQSLYMDDDHLNFYGAMALENLFHPLF